MDGTDRRYTRRMRDAVDGILDQWRVERPDLDVTPIGIFAPLTRAQRVAAGRLEASFTEHDLNRDDFDVLAHPTAIRPTLPPHADPAVSLGAGLVRHQHRADRPARGAWPGGPAGRSD